MIKIEIAADDIAAKFDARRLKKVVRSILADAGIQHGEISVAVVDDATMHELNRRHLQHDYPTDVLSFLLEEDDDSLEGEIIVSADYAAREAERLGWSTDEELLLYVVHGCLHLIGYDDQEPAAKAKMRAQEIRWLRELGVEPRYDAEPASPEF